jgi:sterol desaturase/sphingolipid hydroxylase (fatty acid hydroxylase superfamily)
METKIVIIGFLIILLRYLLFAGVAYFIFYVLKRQAWFSKKIQPLFPKNEQLKRELIYSFVSIIIFFTFFIVINISSKHGYTCIYRHINNHSLFYFICSVPLLFLWHDAYFYFTHRLLHTKAFLKFHKIHHLSHNTTPLTSFSFHPAEAFIQAGFVLIVFFVPIHIAAIAIVMFGQMIFNVIGHLGYELIPQKFHNSFIGKLFNTSTHHNMHHRFTNANYGLYFNIWDKIFNTNHNKYEEHYQQSVRKMYNN